MLLIIVVLVLLFMFKDDLGFGAKESTTVEVPESINVNVT